MKQEQLSLLDYCGEIQTDNTASHGGLNQTLKIATDLLRGSQERKNILPERRPKESVFDWLKRIRPMTDTGPKPKKNVGEAFRSSLKGKGKRKPRIPKGVLVSDELALQDRSDWD